MLNNLFTNNAEQFRKFFKSIPPTYNVMQGALKLKFIPVCFSVHVS